MDALLKYELDAILGLSRSLQDPENMPGDESMVDPVAAHFEKTRLAELSKITGVADFRWDEHLTNDYQDTKVEKRRKKKAVRSELFVDELDGLTYRKHFDADDELIATLRVYELNGD